MNPITHAQRMLANYQHYDQAREEMHQANVASFESAYCDGYQLATPSHPEAAWYMQAYNEGLAEAQEQMDKQWEQTRRNYEYQAELDEQKRQARAAEWEEYKAAEADWHTLQPTDTRTVAELEAAGYKVKFFENTGYNVEETWRSYEDPPTYISLSEKVKLAHAVWL